MGSRQKTGSGDESKDPGEDFWRVAYYIAYVELGLLPDQFWQLTPGELALLQEHHIQTIERQQEMAAFSGYCAASAVAKWWNEGLPPFDQFYRKPQEPIVESTSEDYLARYNSWE